MCKFDHYTGTIGKKRTNLTLSAGKTGAVNDDEPLCGRRGGAPRTGAGKTEGIVTLGQGFPGSQTRVLCKGRCEGDGLAVTL